MTDTMRNALHERALASLEADGEIERRMWTLLRRDMEDEEETTR
jgi:hypothetical protein